MRLFDPAKLLLFTSLLLGTLWARVYAGEVLYLGGVGAADGWFGIPHLILMFAMLNRLSRRRSATTLGSMGLDMAVLIYMAVSVFASSYSPFWQASAAQLSFLAVMTMLYFEWRAAAQSLAPEAFDSVVATALTLAVGLQLLLVCAQLLLGTGVGLAFVGEGPVGTRAGVSLPSVTGTFFHPGNLGLFCTMAGAVLFALAVYGRTWMTSRIAFLGWAMASVTLGLTFARTALLAFGGVIVLELSVVLFLKRKKHSVRKLPVLYSLMAVGPAVVILGGAIWDRFQSLLFNPWDDQVSNRLIHWELALEVIPRKWLAGWGLNNTVFVFQEVGRGMFLGLDNFFFENPVHNIYLVLLVEGGVLLLGAFLFMATYCLKLCVTQFESNPAMSLGVIGAVLGVLAYSVAGWALFSQGQLMFYYYFLLAIGGISFVQAGRFVPMSKS